MGKRRARQARMWAQATGQDWQEHPFEAPRDVLRQMADTTPEIDFCALCDSRHVAYTVCLLIRRPDLRPDAAEQHIFGTCDSCQARYNPEEIEIILRARFGRR